MLDIDVWGSCFDDIVRILEGPTGNVGLPISPTHSMFWSALRLVYRHVEL